MASGQKLIYSGDDELHEGGVAIMISQEAEKSPMEWTPIITTRFYSRCRRLTIIQVYAVHNEREDEEKEQFYQELQEAVDGCKKNDIIIVMGDLNAKVGNDNQWYERTMGVQGLRKQNDNGEIFSEFCQLNGLATAGTLFPYKDIHKATRVAADGGVRNQTDHLLISGQWRSFVLDCRVQRGADASSENFLVRTRIKLRLSSHRNNSKVKPRLAVERLCDKETRKKSCERVRGKVEETRN